MLPGLADKRSNFLSRHFSEIDQASSDLAPAKGFERIRPHRQQQFPVFVGNVKHRLFFCRSQRDENAPFGAKGWPSPMIQRAQSNSISPSMGKSRRCST